MQISPKEDEVKALQKYAGPLKDLSPPEQFLLIMSSVPRLNEKIHLLMLMHQFEVPSYTAHTTTCSSSSAAAWLQAMMEECPI